MATCKDCLHYSMCSNCAGETDLYSGEGHEDTYADVETQCRDFKDKSRFVEVVRCKDCKQYTPVEGGKPLCALHNIACAGDDYCSYGEMRSENES